MVRKGIWWNRTWISELKNLYLGGWWAAHEKLPTETEESLNLTGHSPGQPEQITVLSYFQRIHSTSPTPWFCDLNHPSFYLYKLGLPFLVQTMFPFGSLPNSCSQPWRLQVALQVTVQRFGRSLSHRVPSCLLSSLLWRCSSRQHSVSHERVPYRWNAFFLCWSWGNASVNIDELSLCAWGTGVAIYSTKPVYNLYPASTFL